MKAKAVRSLALGIGSVTGAGVATATFIGDWDAVAAKEAGEATSTQVRTIIKRRMLKLDNFNYNTNPDNNASPDCENASDGGDDLEGDGADDLEGDGADDLVGDNADDLADDDVDCENDDYEDD